MKKPKNTDNYGADDGVTLFTPTEEQRKSFERIEELAGATHREAKAIAQQNIQDLRTLASYPSIIPAPITEQKFTNLLDQTTTALSDEPLPESLHELLNCEDDDSPVFMSDDEEHHERIDSPENLSDEDDEPADYYPGVLWLDLSSMSSRLEDITEAECKNSYRQLQQRTRKERFKFLLKQPSDAVLNSLRLSFPNFSEVIDFYQAQFLLNKLRGRHRIQPVLLLGEPGIGKTHFAQTFARLLGTGYTFIDMASVSDAWVLSGLEVAWRGARAGKIFEAMLSSSTASPVVLLDEIDKSSRADRNPTTPLYQLLEETIAKEFVDEFVGVPADLSGVIYIASANQTEGISEALQSRFRVFNVPVPSGEHHARIVQSVYREETGGTNLFAPFMSDEILDALAPLSVRQAKVKISEPLGKALLDMSPEEIEGRQERLKDLSLELRHFTLAHRKTARIGF